MKLNAIKTACLQDGHFIVYNKKNGEQWIGNRRAFWPVEGIRLNEVNIPAVFDLDDKKLEKLYIIERHEDAGSEEPRITREPMPGTETLCEVAEACIWHKGKLYRPIYTENGVMLLDVSLLKPAENKEGFMEFYERKQPEGGRYLATMIACYGNMFVDAIVVPESKDNAEIIIKAARVVVDKPLAETSVPDRDEGDETEQTTFVDTDGQDGEEA